MTLISIVFKGRMQYLILLVTLDKSSCNYILMKGRSSQDHEK